MKVRQSLIRLHKWQVDEQRKYLSGLLLLKSELRGKVSVLDASVAQEQIAVRCSMGNEDGLGFGYGQFARVKIEQREKLIQSIASLEVRISAAEDAVAEAFKTLKRQEIAAENQARRAAVEYNRKAQIVTDEQAQQSYERKRASS